ncbi:MAG TPA: TonB-dependent receptor [Chryseolinea sp.]|nr:TonB-dependent receptor [Chryseolinea sp.]
MKNIYALLLLTWAINVSAQSTGSISGIIKTSDGNPAEFVNVKLEGTSKGAVAGKKGNYEIKNVTPGGYTLVISFVGIETQKQTIAVESGQNTTADFVISENSQQLQEVVVTSDRLITESVYVSKMPLKNIENPQVYNTVSAQLLKEQVVTNYEDAMKNVPGIFKLWETTGRGGDGGSYYSLRGFETQATIINGMPGLTNGSLDPSNIEKIEVIKGPSGTLFGSSIVSYGGLINTVTKKPYSTFGGEVSYITGSFGLNRITADVNAPVNEDVAVRVNTAYQSENSFQDAGFRNAFFVAPVLSYKVNSKLSFLVSTEFLMEQRTTPPMLFLGRETPLQFRDLTDLNYNTDLSFYSNDLAMKNPSYSMQAQMIYKLSDHWTSQTVLSRSSTRSNGYYSYIYDNQNGNRDFGLYITREQSQTTTTDIQQNFIGDFKLGTMRNRVVAGIDIFRRNVMYGGSGWAWVYNVTPQGEIDYIDPVTGEEAEPSYLSQSSIDNLLAVQAPYILNNRDAAYSAYVSDVLNITPGLMIMASLRVDYFDTEADITTDDDDYSQTAYSPKFGFVYQPIQDKLSVFGNYMNGFRNVAPGPVYNEDGDYQGSQTFRPEHANQWEVGVKSDLFSDRLIGSVSYYDIEVSDVVLSPPSGYGFSTQGGTVRSKGLEFDITANPIDGLNVLLGFSFNDSEVTQGDEGNIWLENGKRPFWAGPKNLANTWITYRVTTGSARGLGFGLGGNYASENNTLDSEVTGKFTLPSYTVVNGSIFYDNDRVRVAFNLNNITDKHYFGGGWSTLNPQKPRNAVLSLSYKF